MSSLRPAGLGPIVGHTTATSARIWVRADPRTDSSSDLDSQTRTIGVLSVRHAAAKPEDATCYYFRLRREFDRSGTINLGADEGTTALDADQAYVVRAGTLLLDDPIDDDEGIGWQRLQSRLPTPDAWREDLQELPEGRSEARFRTFPAEPTDRLDFLLGSCRYPGLLWKVRHADRIFAPMARQVADDQDPSPPRFTLMVGDQIYADMFHRAVPVGRADTYKEFRDRYLTAFSSPNIRRLMRHAPVYMILDDHEIEDNWTQDRLRRNASHLLFTIAIDAYLSYQWSHGPRNFGKRLYYSFDFGGYPFFVVDTRTQRYLEGDDGDLRDNHMLGRPTLPGSPPGQLQRLLNWLKAQQEQHGNVPKFIVTSSVFIPSSMSAKADRSDLEKEKGDSWPGFPNTREAILRCLVDNKVQNVVFLSGDIHCANVAKASIDVAGESDPLVFHAVTSSAFYWPFPFADGEPSDFVHDSKAEGQRDTFPFEDSAGNACAMDYKAGNFTQEDNFCRLSVDRAAHQLRVRTYDRRGDVVEEEDDRGNKRPLDAKLDLIPW
ncbi:MAG: alkaline phosphatase D family protein [Pseudomonadota bacterium]